MEEKILQKLQNKKKVFNNGLIETIGNNINFGYKPDAIASGETLGHQARSYPIANNWQLLSDLYFSDGILQRIVCVPVYDAFKGNIKINSKMLSSDQNKELDDDFKANVLPIFKETAIWARLFGGGGIVIETDSDPAKPLNIEHDIKKGKKFNLYSADLWELNMKQTNPYAEEKPYVDGLDDPTPYNFYGKVLNKNRVIKMLGQIAPSRKRPILRGWGMSEIERIATPYSQYIKYRQVLFETLDETKVSTFYIPMEQLESATASPDAMTNLLKSIQEMSNLKNFKNAMVMPVEAKFEQNELNYGWVKDVFDALQTDFACSCGFPKNKFFGDSATGFGSGQDSLENYNMMIEGMRQNYIPQLKILLQLRCKYLFDAIPDNIQIEFPSLRVLTSEQEEIIKNHQMERILKLYDRGIINAKEVLEQVNLNNLTSMEINDTPKEDFPTPPTQTTILDKNY